MGLCSVLHKDYLGSFRVNSPSDETSCNVLLTRPGQMYLILKGRAMRYGISIYSVFLIKRFQFW
jgi:hypothetical protein